MYYLAVKRADEAHWSVFDEEDRLCYTTGNRSKAEGVSEFLQDQRTPHLEGTKAWIADKVTEHRKGQG